jgi:hypothetical protein
MIRPISNPGLMATMGTFAATTLSGCGGDGYSLGALVAASCASAVVGGAIGGGLFIFGKRAMSLFGAVAQARQVITTRPSLPTRAVDMQRVAADHQENPNETIPLMRAVAFEAKDIGNDCFDGRGRVNLGDGNARMAAPVTKDIDVPGISTPVSVMRFDENGLENSMHSKSSLTISGLSQDQVAHVMMHMETVLETSFLPGEKKGEYWNSNSMIVIDIGEYEGIYGITINAVEGFEDENGENPVFIQLMEKFGFDIS